MSAQLTVLIVEDRPEDRELVLYELKHAGFHVDWQCVDNEADYVECLAKPLDVILADYTLPQFGALRALEILRESGRDIPLIVLTGTVSEEVAVNVMKRGAADYLLKDRLARLGHAVSHALEEKTRRDQKRHADEQLRRYAEELEELVAERTAELKRSKEHVEAILNNTSDAIILLYADGRISQTNPAFSRLFGYFPDELYGQNAVILAAPGAEVVLTAALDSVRASHVSQRIELIARRKDRTLLDGDVAFDTLLEDNKIRAVLCTIRDITDRQQAALELRKALEKEKELNELKSRFTSMVSHDFRTPLAVIQSSSDLLRHYSERMTDERRREQLDDISLQVKRLAGLLDDILAIGRVESVGLEFKPLPVNLTSLCTNVAQETARTSPRHTIEFTSTCASDPMPLDETLMRRAISNLLNNAVKYSPDGGIVRFTLGCDSSTACIVVADSGIGIPPEDLPQLFSVFHRARNVDAIPGTGLGLAIVKQAVDAHGGTITCNSIVGIGTTFTVLLPRVRR